MKNKNLITKKEKSSGKKLVYYGKFPDENGRFGRFGGFYVPETLIPAINQTKEYYNKLKNDSEFQVKLNKIYKDFAGRPTPLYYAKKLSEIFGCRIYLKREDLLHGGAHKLNNTLGQGLLAVEMGKKKLVAETGAGQHGFATAIAGAYFGMETKVFMGAVDIERQSYNVDRMKLLGAEIIPVYSGTQTLKEATSEALRYWTANFEDTHYLIGSVVGPHPYPMMVRDFQSIIGKEIKEQIIEEEGRLPDAIIACIGGGSNAMGAFYNFIEDLDVNLIGVESAGLGKNTNKHALALNKGTEGVLHGSQQLLLQNEDGTIQESYSISAGLDYPGVGPELCYLKEIGRLQLGTANDMDALQALKLLARSEGIIPALESSHAIAYAKKISKKFNRDDIVIINLSGHGGKDLGIIKNHPNLFE
ncbi:MAG: tryptophan synthase subunit beta [Promethearchaeota archaeon]